MFSAVEAEIDLITGASVPEAVPTVSWLVISTSSGNPIVTSLLLTTTVVSAEVAVNVSVSPVLTTSVLVNHQIL